MAEPRPYMNIKVVAFTISEKSINTPDMDEPRSESLLLECTEHGVRCVL